MSFWLNINAAHILIIADDLEISDFLHDILVDAGYNVQKAYTLDDARFMVDYTQFDIAVIDASIVHNQSSQFYDSMSNDLLYGKIPWICVMENDRHIASIKGAHGIVFLAQTGYSPHSVLSTIAQTLDQLVPMSPSSTGVPLGDASSSTQAETRRMFERKLLEHQTLSSIARMLNSSLDLTTVLTKVVDAATSLTSAEEGLLLLPDEEGKKLYIRAAKGIDSDMAKEFRIKTEDTLAGQVYKSGQPLLIGDSGWQKVKTEYFVKSLLYVPMMFKDNPIGVLGVNNRNTDKTFTAHDRDLLLDLASHAAIAIENARLYGESIQRSRELAVLFTASQAVNSTLALNEVLSIITEQMVTSLDLGWCEITTFDSSTNSLHELATYQRAQWQIKQMAKGEEPLYPPAMLKSINSQQRIFLKIGTTNENKDNLRYLALKHAHMICFFPMITEHRPIGVLELIYCQKTNGNLTGNTSTVNIHQLALQLMIAIDSLSINTTEVQTIAQHLLSETGANFCALHLWDAVQETFHKRWSFGKTIWVTHPPRRFTLDDYPVVSRVMEKGSPMHLSRHDQQDRSIRNLLDLYGARTLWILPLVITGTISGVVFLSDTMKQRNYSQREIDMASALIVQAANALKNAWLFRDLQTSLDELRQAQSQLIQAARLSAMGELAAAVAHQINNPLTTVLGDTELILSDMDENDRDYESLLAVNRAGKRAHEVVRRLLGMAHQSDDDAPPQAIDVNESIENTLALVSRHIERQQVTIKVQLEDNLPSIMGLSGQLEDVWMNLLLNARDAVTQREEPLIGIISRLSADKKMVEVEVWDNGTGIAEDKQKDIFTAFFTTKPQGEGTGLGLHICRQVVTKCHGHIQLLESSSQGTRFLVRLPVS